MYNVIRGIILIGLCAVTIILGKEIYDRRTAVAPLSLQEDTGKFLENILKQSDTAGKPENREKATAPSSGKEGEPMDTQKKLDSSPFVDEEDKEITRQATVAGETISAKASHGRSVLGDPLATRSDGISEGGAVTYDDKQMEKIESLYGKAASALEEME